MIGWRLKAALGAVLAFFAAFLGYGQYRDRKATKRTNDKHKAEEVQDDLETYKRVGEAHRNAGDGSWRERLPRQRDKR